ncbi:MAG: DnaJ domain-containing protein [Acidobacteria bacterium]|nr:DnaJ domain-containing protein [Acidobacteriota bacterium]
MEKPEREKNYYTILGADEAASREEIERLYKRLAREHHPDRGGDEGQMKSINEAYNILGNEELRYAYDSARMKRHAEVYQAYRPASSPAAKADALGGRLAGALLCLLLGLVLLFLVKVHYIMFLWPLALLALFIVLLGVLMAHGALAMLREGTAPTHALRRFAWAQELAFWSCVCVGAYGVYVALTII